MTDKGATLALIGFGEAAMAFCRGWAGDGVRPALRAHDIKTDDTTTTAAKWADYAAAGVRGSDTLAGAVRHADAVLSLVTADCAASVATAAAPHLQQGALFLDGNSCAPNTKRANARAIEAAGGCYVDMAIMAPVHPRLHRVPVLLSGPHAARAAAFLARLNMSADVVAGAVGQASSIKMIRSVMVKGLEALSAECLLAGRRAGVAEIVLDSLEKSYPGWGDRAAYNLERMMVHGRRRAAEMREVTRTVRDLGLSGDMARATTGWQQLIGDMDLDAGSGDVTARADLILSALEHENGGGK